MLMRDCQQKLHLGLSNDKNNIPNELQGIPAVKPGSNV